MLVLTRAPGEKIIIGHDISITIIGHSRGQVRLAIDAPQHIAVHREEIYNRLQREGKQHINEKPGAA